MRVSIGVSFHDENSMIEASLRFASIAKDLNEAGSTSIVDQEKDDDDF